MAANTDEHDASAPLGVCIEQVQASGTADKGTSGDRGRRVVLETTRQRGAIAGAIVLRAPLLAKVLSPSLWATHCHQCFRTATGGSPLSRCGRCRTIFYCSRDCQQKDWKLDHRVECACLPQLTGLRLREDQLADVLLLGRVLRRQSPRSTPRASATVNLQDPFDLVWSDADLGQETALLAMLTVKLGLLHDHDWPVRELQQTLSRFWHNNFSICDERCFPIGAGCTPLGAMVNHSCAPNCTVTFEEKTHTLEFRAMRAIDEGEELTYSYVDIALPRAERQARLRRQKHFDCACRRCSASAEDADGRRDLYLDADRNGVPMASWSPSQREQVETQIQAPLLSLSESNPPAHADTDSIRVLHQILASQETLLHAENIQILSTLSQLFNYQIAASDSESALPTGERMLRFYERVYPSRHPMLGLHLMTLGDLAAAMAETTRAVTYWTRALAIIRVTHGDNHSLVTVLQRCLDGVHGGG